MAVSDYVLLKIRVSSLSSPSKYFGCSSHPHGAEESSKPQEANGAKIHIFLQSGNFVNR